MLPSVGRSEPLNNRGQKPSDGQIIKGKVLQLLNAEEAIVEINGRAIKASIEVPLKPGTTYLFQVFRENDGFHLKMIKELVTAELSHNESVDETVKFLGLPADGRSKALVRLFFQHDWPLKSSVLIQARRLLDLSGQDHDWEALKMMLAKKWPLNESLFKSLVAVQQKNTAQTLNTLLSELKGLNLTTPTHQELKSLLENWPSFDEHEQMNALVKGLRTIGIDHEKEMALEKWLIRAFPDHSESIQRAWPEARIVLRKMSTPQDLKAFLNLLGLPVNEDQFFQKASASESLKQLLGQNLFMSHWLKNILGKTGYFYESELRNLIKGQAVDTSALQKSLKGLLISLSQNDSTSDDSIRQTIHHLLQQINGQQLQSLQMDRSFIQLLFAFPLRFQEELRDVHLFWEGKRKGDGSVDPDYCKIAFHFELPHLNETILHILVQERRITVSVYNDHPILDALIRTHSGGLSEKLAGMGYTLVSVKQHAGSMSEAQAIFSPKAGSMDVRI